MKTIILRRLRKVVAAVLVLCMSLIALPQQVVKAAIATDTIVGWDFEDQDNVADSGVAANSAKTISPNSSVFTGYVSGNPGYAINANSWDIGDSWQIEFNASGYENLQLSSMQASSSTGPRDFSIDYSLDGTNWTAVSGGTVTVTPASTWNTIISNLSIPSAVDGQSSVYLRWVVTSSISASGGTLASAGTDRIDNITVTGTASNQAPSVPVVTFPPNNFYFDYNTPILNWNPSSDPDGDSITYNVQVSTTDDFSGIIINEFPTDDRYDVPTSMTDGTYYWRVNASDGYESSAWTEYFGSPYTFTIDTVNPEITNYSASPNSFSPNGDNNKDTTTIAYETSEDGSIYIFIENGSGDLVRTLANKPINQGANSETWDGKDDSATVVPDGVYTAYIVPQDLAGNVPSDLYSVNIEVDNTAPQGTYQSVLDTTNPTTDNNPDVSGRCYSCGPSGFVQAVAPGVSSDISKIEVRYEPIIQNGATNLNATVTPAYYWKEGVMDGNGGYETDDEDGFSYGYEATLSGKRLMIPNGVTIPILPDGEYKVSAVSSDSAGNGRVEPIEEKLVIDTQAPTTPMNLTVTGKTDEAVSLSWNPSTDTGSGVGGYKVLAGTSPGVYTKILNVGTSTNATVIGLDANTLYYFSVIAYDGAMNESGQSMEVSARTNDAIDNLLTSPQEASGFSQDFSTQVLGTSSDGQNTNGGETKGEEKKDEGEKDTQVLAWYWWALLILLLAGGVYVGQKYWTKNQK